MPRIFTSPFPDTPALLRGAALVVIALGVGVWGALLLAPTPRALPPALNTIVQSAPDTAPVAQWFGGAALRVRVTVAGVIASGANRGAALLSIDGGPVRAFRVGHVLAPGVRLQAIEPESVAVDQDGVIERVAVPVGTTGKVHGFLNSSGTTKALP